MISRSDRHARLILHGKEIDEFLGRYTVPLFFMGEQADLSNLIDFGTGVLIELWGRFFILTAGHFEENYHRCVGPEGIILGNERHRFGISIAREPHLFARPMGRAGFVIPRRAEDYGADYGYIEVPPVYKGAIRAYTGGKSFLNPSRLCVEYAEALTASCDRMVLAGFPWAKVERGSVVKTVLFHESTIIAGTGNAVRRGHPGAAEGLETVELSLSGSERICTTSGRFEEISLPELEGVSGGGCWRCGFDGTGPWSAESMQLSAIHTHTVSDFIDGKESRFGREVLIGHHLRLIADDYEDLRRSILSKWPMLEHPDWTTGRSSRTQ